MASTFKNARLPLTTGYQTVYTCPAGTTAVVMSCNIANVDGVNSATASIQWLDSSNSNAATRILELGTVPAGYTVEALVKKLVLEAGDALQAKASADNDLELSVSVLQLT